MTRPSDNSADSEFEISDKEALLDTEDEMLAAFLHAAQSTLQVAKIIIRRDNKAVFAFRIRPLSESEFQETRDFWTKKREVSRGVRIPVETDLVKFRTNLVYKATVDSDKKLLWDNAQAQAASFSGTTILPGAGLDSAMALIDRMLLAGEKDAVIAKIEEISGYGGDVELQERLKNS